MESFQSQSLEIRNYKLEIFLMSYSIYTTDGIVLRRTAFGEQNVLLHILTKNLGMILATVQAARSPKSKLNNSLQEFSLVYLSCVKGRNVWKVTNAEENENFFFQSGGELRGVLARLRLILLQTITGEFPQPEIFETVFSGFGFIKKYPENIYDFEVLVVFRILHKLGYVALDKETDIFLKDSSWNVSLFQQVKNKKVALIKSINKALKESHLT